MPYSDFDGSPVIAERRREPVQRVLFEKLSAHYTSLGYLGLAIDRRKLVTATNSMIDYFGVTER